MMRLRGRQLMRGSAPGPRTPVALGGELAICWLCVKLWELPRLPGKLTKEN